MTSAAELSTGSLTAVLPKSSWRLVVVLGALTMLGPFTMDLYLPAFPAVQRDLLASEVSVQLTLTATAMGMGVGQLIVGPISDIFGRRWPLLLATMLHVISSIGVAVSPEIGLVSLARFGQGVGAAASAIVTVAMVRDLFGGYRLVRMLATIALISGLAPIVAPVLGSRLLLLISWRGVFWVLAIYGVIILICCFFVIPETILQTRQREGGLAAIAGRTRAILTDRVFIGVTIVGSMIFGTLITYLSTSSFVFQTQFGLNPQQFGILFAFNALGLLAATQSAARLMRVFEPAWLLSISLSTLLASGIALILLNLVGAGFLPIAVACFVFLASCGFSNPCVSILILKDQKGRAGTAAAITGFANSMIGGLLSPLPGLIGGASAASLGMVTCGAAFLGLCGLLLIVRPWRVSKLVRD